MAIEEDPDVQNPSPRAALLAAIEKHGVQRVTKFLQVLADDPDTVLAATLLIKTCRQAQNPKAAIIAAKEAAATKIALTPRG